MLCGWKRLYFYNKQKQDLVEWQCLLTKTKAVDNVHPPSLSFPSGTTIARQSMKGTLGRASWRAAEALLLQKTLVHAWQGCILEGHIQHQLPSQVHAFLPECLSHRYVNHSSPGIQQKINTEVITN